MAHKAPRAILRQAEHEDGPGSGSEERTERQLGGCIDAAAARGHHARHGKAEQRRAKQDMHHPHRPDPQPDRAKQFVPVTPDGYVIGDVILFYLDENEFNLVGRAPTIEWVEYHAATGNWNVTVERDERWAMRNDGKRNSYRFQIQGPNAM